MKCYFLSVFLYLITCFNAHSAHLPELIHAILDSDVSRVKVLLETGSDINIQDASGNTALHYALASDNQEIISLISNSKQSDINRQDGDGDTPLIIATKNNNKDLVKLFIERKSDLNKANYSGYTALMLAVQQGNIEIAQLLREAGAHINFIYKNGETLLTEAAYSGNSETVKFLIDAGADVNMPDGNGYTPLLWAAKKGHKDVVKLLLCAKSGKTDKAYIESTDNNGETALFKAVREGHSTIVSELLSTSACVNACSEMGLTPLMIATENSNAQIVQLLLEAKAILDPKDSSDTTADQELAYMPSKVTLLAAAKPEHKEIIEAVMAKPDKQNSAKASGQSTIIKLLINVGEKNKSKN